MWGGRKKCLLSSMEFFVRERGYFIQLSMMRRTVTADIDMP